MTEVRYIIRRTSDNRVLCKPSRPGDLVTWEIEQVADKREITLTFLSITGANNAMKTYGGPGIEVVTQEQSEEDPTVSDRITEYLSAGGLFNPEMMEHDKVRDLIIDAGNELGMGPLEPAKLDNEDQFLP